MEPIGRQRDAPRLSLVGHPDKAVRVEICGQSSGQRQGWWDVGGSGVSRLEVSVLPPASGVEVDWGEGAVDAEGLAGGDLADEVCGEE